jgi:hypothetical protein
VFLAVSVDLVGSYRCLLSRTLSPRPRQTSITKPYWYHHPLPTTASPFQPPPSQDAPPVPLATRLGHSISPLNSTGNTSQIHSIHPTAAAGALTPSNPAHLTYSTGSRTTCTAIACASKISALALRASTKDWNSAWVQRAGRVYSAANETAVWAGENCVVEMVRWRARR